MEQAILNRYGFRYERRNNPPVIEYPQPKPLYSGSETGDAVLEHGEWCLSRCVYSENEFRIHQVMEEHTARLNRR